ncbi:MAG: ATP-binding protein [Bacteroidales bacterium]
MQKENNPCEHPKVSEKLFGVLASNIPHSNVFVFDKDQKIIMFFGREMEKYGYNPNYFLEKNLSDLWDKDTSILLQPLFEHALRGRKSDSEFVFSGDHYMINAIPIRSHTGEVCAGMSVMTNISEEKGREEQLQLAKKAAEAANQTKTEFMANMSHEIRTPLNSIMGFAEQLGKTNLDPEQRKFRDLIEESSDHLLSIVNEILILLRIGAGNISLEAVPFNVRNLFTEVYNTFRIRSQKKGIKLDFNVSKSIPEVLLGDPVRIKQILINLVSNSLKFTQFGYVRCTVKAGGLSENRTELQISIKDTGVGIPKEEMEAIFDPFHQADTSITRKFGGSGLGLTIVKRLVELQNGRISVSSKVRKGTEFTVRIPFEVGRVADLPEEERIYSADKELLKDKKILVVDDDETNQILATTILTNWKLEFDVAGDGDEAMRYLEKVKFDVVLMDIHMPGISGLDLVKRIRGDEGNPNAKTRMIAVTANAIKSDIREYEEAGFQNYLIKPYREEALFNKICNVLRINAYHNNVCQNKEGRTKLSTERTIGQSYDLNELINLSKGDIHFYNKTLQSFVRTAEGVRSKIENHLKQEQWQEVGEQSHKLISSSRFLGMSEMANICIQIEDNTLKTSNYDVVPGLVTNLLEKIDVVVPQLKNEYISEKS